MNGQFEAIHANLFERLLANSRESELYSFDGMPCWEWVGRLFRAYPYLSLRVPGKKNPQGFRAHRVMAELAVGRPLHPTLETIDHGCTICWCIHPMHFMLATASENSREVNYRRRGIGTKPVLKPLIDRELYSFDRYSETRSLPVLRSSLSQECPF